MRKIEKPQHIKAIWGSTDPACVIYTCDSMEYLHPVVGNDEPFVVSCRLPIPFKRDPGEFPSLVEYRAAWKRHRDAQPVCAMIINESLPGYGDTLLFEEDQEFTAWLDRQRAEARKAADKMKSRQAIAGSASR